MRSLFAAMAVAVLSMTAQAEVYKWIDKEGNVHYGDTPPANVRPKTVNVVPPVSGQAKTGQEPAQAEQKAAAAAPAVPPIQVTINPPAPESAPPPSVRGLPFDVFIMLRQGMTEAELLQRAGPPDYMSVDGSVGNIVSARRVGPPGPGKSPRVETFSNMELKNFYYYPTVSDPFTTVVTLTGGRISEMQRTRKF